MEDGNKNRDEYWNMAEVNPPNSLPFVPPAPSAFREGGNGFDQTI
jgi:hypothetical protein